MTSDEITELLPWDSHPVFRHVDAGQGWFEIILDCHRQLAELEPDYRVVQVKEKFGTLRYYVASYPHGPSREKFEAIILEAERRSSVTCEWCGAAGTLRHRGWVRTLCDVCDKKYPGRQRPS